MARLIATMVGFVILPATVGAAELTGTIDKIVDGDTLWLCEEKACHKIRLCGIDTPERSEPGFERAKRVLFGSATLTFSL